MLPEIVIDMNLPPRWVQTFAAAGWKAHHWSSIGEIRASDRTIMEWARSQNAIVFTHDLDFGALLAATNASGPSVVQIRTQDIVPEVIGSIVMDAMRRFQTELETGALISIDMEKARVRVLPLR